MIITRTPFRISFFGGGTDYPAWYSRNEGLVIASTFAQYCYISCRRLPPFFEYKTRIVYSKMESVQAHREIVHPAVRGCLEYLGVENGLEIHHDADLPARSGIGSSSSFTVGLLLALHGLRHEMPTKQKLAEEAIHVEQEVLNEKVGIQDQILSALGGFRLIEMGPGVGDKGYRVTPLIMPPDYLEDLQQHVLLGFTGLTRFASQIAEEQVRKMEKGESGVSDVLALAKEALNIFSNREDIQKLGALLHESWRLKRSLALGITNAAIDDLYEAGRAAGAFGGKLLGAGGGGFMMFLAPPDLHVRIKEALPQVRVWVPFKFDNDGAQVVFHNDEY